MSAPKLTVPRQIYRLARLHHVHDAWPCGQRGAADDTLDVGPERLALRTVLRCGQGAHLQRTQRRSGTTCPGPADGWYEWKPLANAPKPPYYIHVTDNAPLFGIPMAANRPMGAARSKTFNLTVMTHPAQRKKVHPPLVPRHYFPRGIIPGRWPNN
ncbi:SOS response-associated peptidase family protein [Achromobacter xylosoxidans]